MHDSSTPAADEPATLLPKWFQRALIAIAAILMCSCRAEGQEMTPAPCPACESGSCPIGGCEQSCHAGILGPKDEYLCDGDDRLSPVGVLQDGSLAGLEQEDTVGHYRTRDGKIIVAPSSRVCIYAPRFGAVRQVVHPMGAVKRLFVDQVGDARSLSQAAEKLPAGVAVHEAAAVDQTADTPAGLFRTRQQPGATVRLDAVADTIGLVGPYANLQLIHLGVIEEAESATVAKRSLAAITWTGDQQVQVVLEGKGASAVFTSQQPGVVYETTEPNSPRLRIVKLASTDAAHPGDTVDFTIRFDNVGDAPITEVTIVDNLTTRLAFVEGSAKSSVDAEFSSELNDRGSLVLRWEVAEPLEPGDGGVLTFQTRVR